MSAALTLHDDAEISAADEMELHAYFTSFCPPVPGERSGFGAMCTRLSASGTGRSRELPTPGTPWTEIVACSSERAAANFDGEDAMVAHLDGRRRFRTLCNALSRLSAAEQLVLGAYYGQDSVEHPLGRLAGVASLTQAAMKRNRARAARGLHEPVEATVRWLAATVAPEARVALEELTREARAAVGAARRAYATVRQLR